MEDDTLEPTTSQDQMVKKLVRLALASEHSRTPLRRADITARVIGNSGTRTSFKTLLAAANNVLTETFGVRLTELPARTHNTVAQKRAAAAKSQTVATQPSTQSQKSNASGQASYVLTSAIPFEYRSASILTPPACPTPADEAAFSGLYSFIVTLILLSPSQSLAEGRLMRHLGRMNAEDYWTSGEKTDVVLKRMERQGYIIKVRERDGGGEESVDYVVGPRGKVEVGEKGAAGLVRGVYYGGASNDVNRDELERRLVRSLGDGVLQKTSSIEEQADEAEVDGEEAAEQEGEEEDQDDAE